jgi:hypothetical protein
VSLIAQSVRETNKQKEKRRKKKTSGRKRERRGQTKKG